MKDYEKTLKLSHNEIAAKVNIETGETITFEPKPKPKPRDKSMDYFESSQPYKRQFHNAWDLLETQTSPLEFRVAEKLGRIAAAYTNSLAPLSPESTKVELSETLGIDRSVVEKTINKLFKLGVIGKFEVYDRYATHHYFWIFNPYLSFNGKVIKRDVKCLFDSTFYANMPKPNLPHPILFSQLLN